MLYIDIEGAPYKMSLFGYLFVFFIISILFVTGILLAGYIGSNYSRGRALRENLLHRIGMLRLGRMLKKRGIDVHAHLHKHLIHDIEKEIRQCESCERIDECENALKAKTQEEEDLSFCPNNEKLKQVKIDLSSKKT